MSTLLHVMHISDDEALSLASLLLRNFREMTHARVTADMENKQRTERIIEHANWVYPLAGKLKMERGGLYRWPAEWFGYIARCVSESIVVSQSLKDKFEISSKFSYTSEEIATVRSTLRAEAYRNRKNKK